jgi:hypothetical protein
VEEGVRWAEGGWGVVLGEEGGVFDGIEDVEIGESADDGEEDDGFYGCVCCMEGKGPEEKAHRSRAVSRTIAPTFLFETLTPN